MKKLLWTVLCAAGLSACLCAGEKLWDGSPASVKLVWGKELPDVSVKAENGVLDISAASRGKSVTYVSVEIAVKPFKLDGRRISFDAWSSEEKTTDAFFFRAQDAKKRNILSFQRWRTPLKSSPETRLFSPGVSVPEMMWESKMIKASPDAEISRLVFFIGSRGDGKKMNLKLRNIELVGAVSPKPSAMPGAGEKLWDGSPESVKLDWGKELPDVSVKAENGVLDISAASRGKSVTYVSVEIAVKPFKLDGRRISFDAWSSEEKTTDAFFFRAQDAKKRNILSFQRWRTPLKSSPETRLFSPGVSVPKMKWESEMIKADPDARISRLVFFIGSHGDGRKMNLKLRNIELVDAVLPKSGKE